MKRKIIKQGHNTLTITLPAEWTSRMNLEAGKELDIVERDNGLLITTERRGKSKRAELDISDMDIPLIWKHFMSIYREGYDEILVKFKPGVCIESPYKFLTFHRVDLKYYKKQNSKKPMFEALQGFVNRFIGLEIIEHGKDYIIVKEMGELTSKEFDNSLRRVFLLIQQMSGDVFEAIKTKNTDLIENMHDVDINLDKFQDYCIRILNCVCNKDARKTSLLFTVLYLLELIGDEFKNISHHLVSYKKPISFENIESLARAIKEQIDVFYSLFYKFDKEKINELSEIDARMYAAVPEIYKRSGEREKEIYHHLRIIERYINSLLELRIEMEY